MSIISVTFDMINNTSFAAACIFTKSCALFRRAVWKLSVSTSQTMSRERSCFQFETSTDKQSVLNENKKKIQEKLEIMNENSSSVNCEVSHFRCFCSPIGCHTCTHMYHIYSRSYDYNQNDKIFVVEFGYILISGEHAAHNRIHLLTSCSHSAGENLTSILSEKTTAPSSSSWLSTAIAFTR